MFQILKVLIVSTLTLGSVWAEQNATVCSEPTRPYKSRCDWYYRCALLPSKTYVWIITQCPSGLIYEHGVGTCVVPDNDWECNISPGKEQRKDSEENVYGIDSFRYPSFIPSADGNSSPKVARPRPEDQNHYQLPNIIGGDQQGIYILMDEKLNNRTSIRRSPSSSSSLIDPFGTGDELESSGDDMTELFADGSDNGSFKRGSNQVNEGWSGMRQGVKAKLPLPPDGKIHPDHLSQIIKQQHQLNRIAAHKKPLDEAIRRAGVSVPLIHKPAILPKLAGGGQYAANGEGGEQVPKAPFMSEQIIKSILQISQQIIAGRKPPTADTKSKDQQSYNPIFIPISSSNADPATGPMKMESTSATFGAKPIGLSIIDPSSMAHTAVVNNLRNHSLHKLAHGGYETVLFDAYGNKYLAKDAYQLEPSNYPSSAHNSLLGPSLATLAEHLSVYPSVPSQHVSGTWNGHTDARNTSNQKNGEPSSTDIHATIHNYSSFGSTFHHNELPELEENNGELDDSTSTGSDSELANTSELLASKENSNESEQSNQEASGSEENETLNHKLFTLAEPGLYASNPYKASIMPLLNANPEDVRISVVTCAVGNRQPNMTDCFKYYVCNSRNGALQSFTCPSFTAFNKDSRMCDIGSYAACKAKLAPIPTTPRPLLWNKGSAQNANLLQRNDILTAQRYVELMRQEANKLLTRNNLPPPQITSSSDSITIEAVDNSVGGSSIASSPAVKVRRKSSTTKRRISIKNLNKSTTTTAKPGKRRVQPTAAKVPRCRLEGRVPDPKNKSNYYVCHRKSSKKFIKVKVACPKDLMYCAELRYCTVETNC